MLGVNLVIIRLFTLIIQIVSRHLSVQRLYYTGNIGETGNGLLALHYEVDEESNY